ncbi:unnamed protein product [Porites lobata]|uniref:ABC transmembrane type-1 domain-containing protein n=1 Tax=Porites lobata TaxID=104759 RepID=A0ABN8NPS6_9CNID|nr:unnamed protein product [Porites lobata]
MYSVEIIKLPVIDSPVLFLFRYIVNRFGLEIAIDLVRAVDLESVEILGRIMQFPFAVTLTLQGIWWIQMYVCSMTFCGAAVLKGKEKL